MQYAISRTNVKCNGFSLVFSPTDCVKPDDSILPPKFDARRNLKGAHPTHSRGGFTKLK